MYVSRFSPNLLLINITLSRTPKLTLSLSDIRTHTQQDKPLHDIESLIKGTRLQGNFFSYINSNTNNQDPFENNTRYKIILKTERKFGL